MDNIENVSSKLKQISTQYFPNDSVVRCPLVFTVPFFIDAVLRREKLLNALINGEEELSQEQFDQLKSMLLMDDPDFVQNGQKINDVFANSSAPVAIKEQVSILISQATELHHIATNNLIDYCKDTNNAPVQSFK